MQNGQPMIAAAAHEKMAVLKRELYHSAKEIMRKYIEQVLGRNAELELNMPALTIRKSMQ